MLAEVALVRPDWRLEQEMIRHMVLSDWNWRMALGRLSAKLLRKGDLPKARSNPQALPEIQR